MVKHSVLFFADENFAETQYGLTCGRFYHIENEDIKRKIFQVKSETIVCFSEIGENPLTDAEEYSF